MQQRRLESERKVALGASRTEKIGRERWREREEREGEKG
jgi:hypothetical protein